MHKVIEDYIRMCYDGYKLGWHERNGGNLTYRMKPEEVEGCRNLFTQDRHLDLPIDASALAGEHFITSGSGKYMRNMPLEPERNMGIIRIDDDGAGYTILWGLEDDAKPTSELPSHLLNHIARCAVTDGRCRVIYHGRTSRR